MVFKTKKHIERFAQQDRIQAGSLIVSLFGDAVYPRGGSVWLGCLIHLLAPLQVNERLIRTAIFRLVKDDWLLPESQGRRTNYCLSQSGLGRIAAASRHIYAVTSPPWDGHWRLLMMSPELALRDKEKLKKSLRWQGFGVWQNMAFVHPGADLTEAMSLLKRDGLGHLQKFLWPLNAQGIPLKGRLSDTEVITQTWGLHQLADSYQRFVKTYAPLCHEWQNLDATRFTPHSETAFLLRLLLIHDYRRLLLRDPMLPKALLPEKWPGELARETCQGLYEQLRKPSETYLDQALQLADGQRTKSQTFFKQRFKKC